MHRFKFATDPKLIMFRRTSPNMMTMGLMAMCLWDEALHLKWVLLFPRQTIN